MSTQQQQQHDNDILTVKALDQAVALLLANNFDADSQVCLVTILKILDNVLHKPHNDAVRKLRLQNATVWSKVGQRTGGIAILEACGFCRVTQPPPLLSDSLAEGEACLILKPEREDQALLLTARRLLHTRAVQDLHMDPKQLPEFRTPPPPVSTTNNNASSSTSNFDIYSGHRYDAKSAAVGQQLGPGAGYKSKTESELEKLQSQQRALEQKYHTQPIQRQWQAWGPATMPTTPATTSASASSGGPSSGGGSSSDASLLAARLQKQQAEQKQRDEGGFTTSAMRQVQRLKQQKVYRYATLTLQFPSGHAVRGQFLPKEMVHDVISALCTDCLLTTNDQTKDAKDPPLELYVTPPRRRLPPTSTLQDEGLVPAAKVFVSWKAGRAPTSGEFLQPGLFASAHDDTAAFPTGQGLGVGADKTTNDHKDAKPAAAKKKKASKSDRQEEMLKRMMGKGGGL